MRVINFYRAADDYGQFSNFWEEAVHIGDDDRPWRSTEHYFQAKKFEGAPDEEEIRQAATPKLSAQMGRDRNRPLRSDWNSILEFSAVPDGDSLRTRFERYVGEPMLTKDWVMLVALRAKFSQHEDLRNLLVSTGDAILVEHTVNDSYWGDAGDGTGKNMLGKLLMLVREELSWKLAA